MRDSLRVRVGCEFRYEAPNPTPTVFQVQPREDGAFRLLRESWDTSPTSTFRDYHDLYGNLCRRLTLPTGAVVVSYDATLDVPPDKDPVEPAACQLPMEEIPDDALIYTLPSRYCQSDLLADEAWRLFGHTTPGWERVQAICDWVHGNIRFEYGASTPVTTASDVYQSRVGVCRDFTHLGVTLCRALNIPARYVFGYLPDIAVPPPDSPMDFCAWFEAYLDHRWWTFDPRNNVPRVGRVLIGRGRDAIDVAMATSYGAPVLTKMTVWADEVPAQPTDDAAMAAVAPAPSGGPLEPHAPR